MLACPICSNSNFTPYGGRTNAHCVKCGALERGRLAWMALTKLDLLREGVRLLNFAPEPFMLTFGRAKIGDSYTAADFHPKLFAKYNLPIRKIDMCNDLSTIETGAFDVVMHNHVLEHLPCDPAGVLREINRFLTPGGVHLFSTPIMPNRKTTADLNPNLSEDERRKRFGQGDHMRMFGADDFGGLLSDSGMGAGLVDLSAFISPDDIEKAALPPEILVGYNPHRVFVWRKP